ncbi:hypothetical protein BDQ12DRAFT_684733 [Crucibulum laeve]|uniref:Uncharacterized protein n=1 Tax=Crucibulum laeve TaxID=68775 RepID=A0A5C3LZJ6_9AGAR|nr:hypothetical protein BDQ12DRAFT_684733 [Crucibulum laeve]
MVVCYQCMVIQEKADAAAIEAVGGIAPDPIVAPLAEKAISDFYKNCQASGFSVAQSGDITTAASAPALTSSLAPTSAPATLVQSTITRVPTTSLPAPAATTTNAPIATTRSTAGSSSTSLGSVFGNDASTIQGSTGSLGLMGMFSTLTILFISTLL